MTPSTEGDLTALARTVGDRLQQAGLICATAESCTGGLVGHLITEIAGCSHYFAGGVIAYSNAAKEQVLGVEPATLVRDGAVSAAVARQMAHGARRLLGAHVAVAVTGIAGPAGAVPGKPVGTVYIHVSAADGYEQGKHCCWPADRSTNKLLSAGAALQMLLDYVEAQAIPASETSEKGRR